MSKFLLKNPVLTATVFGFALAALPQAVRAASTEIPPDVLRQLRVLSERVQELEQQKAASQPVYVQELNQKVKVLERRQELADEEAAKVKKEQPLVVAGEKGFGLKSADGNFELKLRGLVQADGRYFDNGIKGQHTGVDSTTKEASNNLLVRRARPTIEGSFFEKYGFRITPDFGGSSTTLVDAYVDGNFDPAFKVRAGKFTPPLGLERLQSSADTKFAELALVSNFLPSRDVGVQLGGDVLGNTLNYSVGIFNGAADGATGDNSDGNTDKELQARLFAQPFLNQPGFFQGLGLGVAASVNDGAGGTGNTGLSKFKTPGQEDFFGYRGDTSIAAASNPVTKAEVNTVYLDGERTRLVPQFHYFNGSIGLLGEYVEELQGLSRFKSAGGIPKAENRSDKIENDGWQLTTAWAITGEEESLKGIKPAQNFDPGNGGWGAWELVARTGELNIDKDAFLVDGVLGNSNSFADATKSAQSAQNWGVGVNWYLNKVVRVSLDYDHTDFVWGGGGKALLPKDRADEDVVVSRIQASF